jgi:hypothetical protein
LSSAPSQRSAPAPAETPRWNPAPQAAQAAPADSSQQIFSAVDRALEVVQSQGVQVPKEALDFFNAAKSSGATLDPAIVNFYEANKGLLPS